MRLLFDHQIFSYQKYGGISKYFSHLYREFLCIDDVETQLGLTENVNYHLGGLLKNKDSDIKKIYTDSLFRKYFIYKRNKKHCLKLFRKKKFDILHSTFYDPYTLRHNRKPHVITVHDMMPEIYPGYYRGTVYSYFVSSKWIKGKKELIEKADKIIAVSENTKKDLMEIYNVDGSRIEVIHHGCNTLPEPSLPLIEGPYVLFVGLRQNYKNFMSFIKAVEPLIKKENIKVLCVGGGKFSKTEEKYFYDRGIERKLVQISVDDAGLAAAYKNALCFVFPSEYEGFGMPVLEAFSCGCPVVLSDRSSFPEVAGDAAVYFDPSEPDSIAAVLQETIYDSGKLPALRSKGLAYCEKFSWNETAQKTLEAYRSVLNI